MGIGTQVSNVVRSNLWRRIKGLGLPPEGSFHTFPVIWYKHQRSIAEFIHVSFGFCQTTELYWTHSLTITVIIILTSTFIYKFMRMDGLFIDSGLLLGLVLKILCSIYIQRTSCNLTWCIFYLWNSLLSLGSVRYNCPNIRYLCCIRCFQMLVFVKALMSVNCFSWPFLYFCGSRWQDVVLQLAYKIVSKKFRLLQEVNDFLLLSTEVKDRKLLKIALIGVRFTHLLLCLACVCYILFHSNIMSCYIYCSWEKKTSHT